MGKNKKWSFEKNNHRPFRRRKRRCATSRKVLNQFRENDVVVIGIGITKAGEAIRNTYAPDGLVCEEANNLASTVGALLEKYLEELNGKK